MNLEKMGRFTDAAILLVRIAFGFRLVYGTADNIVSYERMLEFRDFLEMHGFPFPLVSAFVSVILQFAAGFSWAIGYQVRLASLLMTLNFAVAIIMVHLGDTYLNTAPAIHLLVISLFLLAYGPGKYALGHTMSKGSGQ